MQAIGHVVKPDSDQKGFQLKPFESEFTVKTDDGGQMWLIMGTDSGYEGLTTIYFTNVSVSLKEIH